MAEEVNAAQGAAFAFFPISLVVAEVLNNSIQHGVNFKSSGQLRVRHLGCQNCIEITLIDTGCAYPPPTTKDPRRPRKLQKSIFSDPETYSIESGVVDLVG